MNIAFSEAEKAYHSDEVPVGAIVVNKNRIIGTISEGDVLRSLLIKKNLKSPAKKIMNKSFKYLLIKKDLKEARKIFLIHHVNIIPIVNKKFELLDVLTLKDLFNK